MPFGSKCFLVERCKFILIFADVCFSTIYLYIQLIILVVYFLQVINPYINCICAQDNLRVREGQKVFPENTLISDLMYRYGKYLMNHKPDKKNPTECSKEWLLTSTITWYEYVNYSKFIFFYIIRTTWVLTIKLTYCRYLSLLILGTFTGTWLSLTLPNVKYKFLILFQAFLGAQS